MNVTRNIFVESGHTRTSLFSPLPLYFGIVALSPNGLDIQEDVTTLKNYSAFGVKQDIQEDVTTCEKLFSLWGFAISEIS